MATTIGSLDLNAFSDLYSDSTQYFWFEGNASATYGAGAHVTLVPDTSFISNPTGQNILMNTDGFSIRNGLLPMMTLDNDSLDFNVVNTTAGTYVATAMFTSTGAQIGQGTGTHLELNTNGFSILNGSLPMMTLNNGSLGFNVVDTTAGTSTTTATFTATGAQIGQSSSAHSVIDANGQRFYASDGTTQLANIGYGEGTDSSGGEDNAPYYTLGFRNTITPTVGNYSVVEGNWCTASAYCSHAEGSLCYATGYCSHAEGNNTISRGDCSHAEGELTTARGLRSHAEGGNTTASALCSHAEGSRTIAQGIYSHVQNLFTVATEDSQTVIGKYNAATVTGSGTTSDPYVYTDVGDYAFIIGNGTDNPTANRSNALTVDWNGNVLGQAMAGIIQMYAGATPPTGWLVCDGASYLRSDYPTLFEALGGTSSPWGLPDSTHFNVPDFRGRAPIGYGDGTATSHTQHNLGTYGGNEDSIVPYHNHSVNSVSIGSSGGHTHTITNKYTSGQLSSGSNAPRFRTDGNTNTTNFSSIASNTGTHTHSVPSHNTNYAGTSGDTVGANMMPYATISFIICTGKTKTY